jgi:hypothetical protein
MCISGGGSSPKTVTGARILSWRTTSEHAVADSEAFALDHLR